MMVTISLNCPKLSASSQEFLYIIKSQRMHKQGTKIGTKMDKLYALYMTATWNVSQKRKPI